MKTKIILDLCGGTGAWSEPYRENGYDVRIIDILTGCGDVRIFKKPNETIYGVLAAPPCTNLAGSGARWWQTKGEASLLENLSIVDACLRIIFATRPVFWALENPVGRLTQFLGKPIMYFEPFEFAGFANNPESQRCRKKTALWGRFNPPVKNPLLPIPPNKNGMPDRHYNGVGRPRGMPRWIWRSITPEGFARAFYEANK